MVNDGIEEEIVTGLGTEFRNETDDVAAEIEEMGNELEVTLLVNEMVYLTVGAESDSFTALYSAISEYQRKNRISCTEQYRRDMRTIEIASSRNTKKTYKNDIKVACSFCILK